MSDLTEEQHEALRGHSFASDEAVERFLEVHGWLSRLRYKPNFTFTLESRQVPSHLEMGRPLDDLLLRTEMIVQDTYNPERTAPVVSLQVIPDGLIDSFEEFIRWWRTVLHAMENHEMNEWILVDGERRFDPHAKRIGW